MTFVCVSAKAQNPITLLESTIKITGFGEEVFYFGFAEGDQIILNFTEVNRKELKEIEITEWPSTVKYAEFKTNRVDSKVIQVYHTAIFKFRFSNPAIGGRICKIQIQRIPASATTQEFNTNVYWRTVSDTTYTPLTERYLISSDTSAVSVVDQIAKVSSQSALNGNSNTTIVDIDLPPGTTVWSYYIGVGKEGKAAFDVAREKFLTAAGKQASQIEGYGTMAALAIYGLNLFAQAQGNDNVKYCIIPDWNNVQLFQSRQAFQAYKVGDVVNDASRMVHPLQGKIFIGLTNDNLIEPIEVLIKVTAIKISQAWGERIVKRISIQQRQEAFL